MSGAPDVMASVEVREKPLPCQFGDVKGSWMPVETHKVPELSQQLFLSSFQYI